MVCAMAHIAARLHAARSSAAARRNIPAAGPGAHAALDGGRGEEGAGFRSLAGRGHRRRARLLLSRRYRAAHRQVQPRESGPAAIRGHGRFPAPARRTGLHHLPRLPGLQARILVAGTGHDRSAQHSGGVRPEIHGLEFGRLHSYAGGSAEAGLCRPRHVLRRSEIRKSAYASGCSRRNMRRSGAS